MFLPYIETKLVLRASRKSKASWTSNCWTSRRSWIMQTLQHGQLFYPFGKREIPSKGLWRLNGQSWINQSLAVWNEGAKLSLTPLTFPSIQVWNMCPSIIYLFLFDISPAANTAKSSQVPCMVGQEADDPSKAAAPCPGNQMGDLSLSCSPDQKTDS